MDNSDKKLLIDNTVFLSDNLVLSSMLMDRLVSLEVLTVEMREQIEAQSLRRLQVRELLKLLPLRGPMALQHFFMALIDSKQGFIANKIATSETSLLKIIDKYRTTKKRDVECDCPCEEGASGTPIRDPKKQIALRAKIQAHDLLNAPRRPGPVARRNSSRGDMSNFSGMASPTFLPGETVLDNDDRMSFCVRLVNDSAVMSGSSMSELHTSDDEPTEMEEGEQNLSGVDEVDNEEDAVAQ